MGEPSGSRRLTDAHDAVKQPGREQPEASQSQPRPPRSTAEDVDDTRADERTSPSPYAESFEQWVEDEVAPDRRQREDG
jgi:hypothetical protein